MTTDSFLFNAGSLFFAAWIAIIAGVTIAAASSRLYNPSQPKPPVATATVGREPRRYVILACSLRPSPYSSMWSILDRQVLSSGHTLSLFMHLTYDYNLYPVACESIHPKFCRIERSREIRTRCRNSLSVGTN
jgi:hypothetical protein